MVPPHHVFLDSDQFEHFKHLSLVFRVDRFDRNSSPNLRHGKHVSDFYREWVGIAAQHQAHDLKRNPLSAVFEHLEKSEGVNVDLLGCVLDRHGVSRSLEPGVGSPVGNFLESSEIHN